MGSTTPAIALPVWKIVFAVPYTSKPLWMYPRHLSTFFLNSIYFSPRVAGRAP